MKKSILLPILHRRLIELGENIRLARLRRKYSATMVATRAGISRNTLRAIESGDPKTSIGAYVNVLFVLGLEESLNLIARDDSLGQKIQDAGLLVKSRAPKRNKKEDLDYE